METEAKSSLFLSDEEINHEIEIRNDNISILPRKCHKDDGYTFSIATVEANLDCSSNHQTVKGSEIDHIINQPSDNNKDFSVANRSRESVLINESRYQQYVKQSISNADNLSGNNDSCQHIDSPGDITGGKTDRMLNLISDCNDKSSALESSEAHLTDILNFIEVDTDNISASVAACAHSHAKRTVKSNSEAIDKLEKRNLSMMDKVPDGSEIHFPSSEQLLVIVSSSVEALYKTDDASDYKSLDSGESLSLCSGDTSAMYCVKDSGNEYTAVYKDYLKQEIESGAQIKTYSCNESLVEDELLAELENEFLSTAEIILLGENPDSSFQCRTLTSKLDAVQRRLEHTLNQRKELEVENVRLEQKLAGAINNMESLKLELESLITTQQRDNGDLKAKIDVIEEKAREALADMQNEHQHTIEQLTKLYEDCIREKDAVVVRYAQAEQKNIDVQDRLQRAETRVKEWTKEREIALVKWHAMKTDLKNSTELNQTLAAEVSALRKEVEKYKDLTSSADVKVKWQQNKLKAEQDVLKETKTKLQEVEDKVKELKQEEFLTLDQIRSLFLILQEVDDGKIPVEIMQKKELSDIDELLPVIRKGLRLVEMKERELVAELKTLRDKVCCLEVERLSQEQSLNCIKDDLYNQQQGNMDLQDRILKLEKAENIMHEREILLRETVIRVAELESVTQDQRVEIEQFMKREAEQLAFTSRISDKNTHLVAENSRVSYELFTANRRLEEAELQCTVLKEQNQNLTEELAKQRNKAAEDARSLMEILEREQLKLSDVQLKLEEIEDEMKTTKRRHASNIKDLTRQLQIANRRVFDGKDFGLNVKTERDNASLGSLGSQGGSCGSLDTAGLMAATSSESPVQCEERKTEEHGVKESLLEKIGSLEKTMRNKCEKIEFLRDHVDQLIEELHRKSRIIQEYVLREEAGTLVPESSDKNKAQLAKKGGVMASLYASHALDGSMTMSLSLEINRKLQALLEDTLLKNMKLKEGMDTLGQEIDWLSQENKRLRHELERTADQPTT